MNSIFSFRNPISQLAVKLIKLLWLNLLWIITSIPIFTIGASTCALYYTTMRLARDDDTYITKDFFSAFRTNFKKATFFFFMIAVIVSVCGLNFFIMGKRNSIPLRLTGFVSAGFLLFFSLCAIYLLPLTAQFENTIPGTFQTALAMFVRNIHWSFCLLILDILLPLLILFKFLPLIIFGFPLPVFIQSYILNHIFKKYLPGEVFEPGSVATIESRTKVR